MKIVIAGGEGFIGSRLTHLFREMGHDVYPLSRTPAWASGNYAWNPGKGEIHPEVMPGADLVINAAGGMVASRVGRSNPIQERTLITNFLIDQMAKHPPKLFFNGSFMGVYCNCHEAHSVDPCCTGGACGECGPLARTNLARGLRVEESAALSKIEGVRTVVMRYGLILGKEGGVLKRLRPLFNAGLGRPFGKGEETFSWVELDEIASMIMHIVKHEEISGPVNLCSPEVVTKQRFTQVYAKALHRPAFPLLPAWLLKLLFPWGEEFYSLNVKMTPKALIESNYQFQCTTIEEGMAKALR